MSKKISDIEKQAASIAQELETIGEIDSLSVYRVESGGDGIDPEAVSLGTYLDSQGE